MNKELGRNTFVFNKQDNGGEQADNTGGYNLTVK